MQPFFVRQCGFGCSVVEDAQLAADKERRIFADRRTDHRIQRRFPNDKIARAAVEPRVGECHFRILFNAEQLGLQGAVFVGILRL